MSSRAQTQLGTRKDTINSYQKVAKEDPKAMNEEINQLKIQIQKMESEKKVLHSKTSRMKQIIHDRNGQINQALHQANEHQSIKTASPSTISQLQENIYSLQNTRDSRLAELDELQKNDRLSISDEMKVELQEYYNEYERLKEQNYAVHQAEAILHEQLRKINDQVLSIPKIQASISELSNNVQELTDKIVAYRKSQLRNECAQALQKVLENPANAEEVINQVQADIQSLEEETKRQEEELSIIQENDQKNIEFLQSIIDDQTQKINAALEELQNASKGN